VSGRGEISPNRREISPNPGVARFASEILGDLQSPSPANRDADMTVIGSYDFYLVALSILVACFASYTALDLGGRVRV